MTNRERLIAQGFKYATRCDDGKWHGTDWGFGTAENPTVPLRMLDAPEHLIIVNPLDGKCEGR